MKRKIIILTGEKEAGKSSICDKLIQYGKEVGLKVEGFISPRVVDKNEKAEIQLRNVITEETRILARKRGKLETHISTEAWDFDESTINWGEGFVKKIKHTDILLFDEIGILEILRNQGFTSTIGTLHNAEYSLAIVVVRPTLCDALIRKIGKAEKLVVDATSRDEIVEKLKKELVSIRNKRPEL